MTVIEARYWKLIEDLCSGQPEAFAWFHQVCAFAEVWDDIADGDAVDHDKAMRAFEAVVSEWPLNQFVRTYAATLVPVMVNAFSAWGHSNLQTAPKVKAYDVYTEIPCTMAFLLGGRAMVNKYLPEVRRLTDLRLAEDEAEDNGAK